MKGEQAEFPFDIYTEILKHIESVKDLHEICLMNKDIKRYCDTHKKVIFSYLLKNRNFKNNFYNIFDLFIKFDNTTLKEDLDKMNWYKIKKLLRFYPVGEMSKNSLINNLQIDFLKVFYNLSHDEILNNQDILKDIFMILFYPSNYIDIFDDILILYRIDKFISEFVDEKYKNKIILIYIYHLNNIKREDKELFYEILDNLLESIISEIMDESNVQFMEILNILIKEFSLSKSYINDIYNRI